MILFIQPVYYSVFVFPYFNVDLFFSSLPSPLITFTCSSISWSSSRYYHYTFPILFLFPYLPFFSSFPFPCLLYSTLPLRFFSSLSHFSFLRRCCPFPVHSPVSVFTFCCVTATLLFPFCLVYLFPSLLPLSTSSSSLLCLHFHFFPLFLFLSPAFLSPLFFHASSGLPVPTTTVIFFHSLFCSV